MVGLLPEFSPDQGLLGQSSNTCGGRCLASRYRTAETTFPKPSPLRVASPTADADDPLWRGGTQGLQALPTLSFNLGEAFEQSVQKEGITHRARLQHR